MTTLRALCLFFALLLLPGTAGAMTHPNLERGFDPDNVYQLGQLDQVNLFSGGLSLTIPIGQRYPVGGGLSYGFTLVYSSSVWDFEEVIGSDGLPYLEALPNHLSNAGLGWRVSLGELYRPNDPPHNFTDKWIYVGPDGAAHVFYDDLHIGEDDGSADHLYTRDGSYLRLAPVDGQNYNYWKKVEFPDGTYRVFFRSGCLGCWYLDEIGDAFGNWVQIDYPGTVKEEQWQITDSEGRQHDLYFQSRPQIGYQLDQADLAAFNGTQATYLFSYWEQKRQRSCKDTLPDNNDRITVPLLTKVTLPDGSYYQMTKSGQPAYYDGCSPTDVGAVLERLRLPTGGFLEWTFQDYDFPDGPAGWANTSTGVKERRLVRKDETVEATWEYANFRWREGGSGPYTETRTHVTGPDGSCTKHYFSAPTDLDKTDWSGWEYGLCFTTSAEHQSRYLSSEIWDSHFTDGGGRKKCDSTNGTRLRSKYVLFAHDKLPSGTSEADKPRWYNTNRRIVEQAMVYDDDPDGERWTSTVYSDFDGLGHYRFATSSGNLEGDAATTEEQTSFTNFNRGTGTYEIGPLTNTGTANHTYQVLPTTEEWILGIFDAVEVDVPAGVAEGESFARVEYQFDRATGFLECTRTIPEGSVRTTDDVVSIFLAGADGHVTRLRLFDGLGTTELCDPTGANFDSRTDYTYGAGSLTTAQAYWHGPGQGINPYPYLSVDADIDLNTALVTTARDPQNRTTTLTYDDLGRPLEIIPTDLARTVYTYTTATPTTPPKVTVQAKSNDGTQVLTTSEVEFDDFGRVVLRRQLLPGSVWSEQETTYDTSGRVATVSVPGDLTKKTEYLDYDAFGRATTIRPPDGASHDITFTYHGVRRVDTDVSIATSLAGETYVTRREYTDNWGRLREVREPSRPNGTDSRTIYDYDVGGRLSRIDSNMDDPPNNQIRTFLYDNRGFLLEEMHPEKGTSTDPLDGFVYYSDYDAAGRVGRIVDGPSELVFDYDHQGRVLEVREVLPDDSERPVKQFVYDETAGTYGKLDRALRYNYVAVAPSDVVVTEHYTYAGKAGAVSARTTDIAPWGFSFDQSFTYTELGQIETLTYPTCTHATCASVTPGISPVTYTYDQGLLATVGGWTTGAISYHPNGMLHQLPHANGVTDIHELDPNSLIRPKAIRAWDGTTNVWETENFGYDGAGNVKAIGTQSFVYDGVSRLVEAYDVEDHDQTYTYDVFGNMTERTTTYPDLSTETVAFATYKQSNRLSMASYDTAGNMTSWGGSTYEYDAVHQLLSLTTTDGDWYYAYTADEERILALRDDPMAGTKVAFSLRGLDAQVLSQFFLAGPDQSSNWSRMRDYVRGAGRLIASSGVEGDLHYHLDHLGTPRCLSDTAATCSSEHDYLPFGEEISDPSQNSVPMKFTGHERDAHGAGSLDDLDYMHARYYSLHLARLFQVDPAQGLHPQRLNRYAYVENNPITLVDPGGRSGCYPTPYGEHCDVEGEAPDDPEPFGEHGPAGIAPPSLADEYRNGEPDAWIRRWNKVRHLPPSVVIPVDLVTTPPDPPPPDPGPPPPEPPPGVGPAENGTPQDTPVEITTTFTFAALFGFHVEQVAVEGGCNYLFLGIAGGLGLSGVSKSGSIGVPIVGSRTRPTGWGFRVGGNVAGIVGVGFSGALTSNHRSLSAGAVVGGGKAAYGAFGYAFAFSTGQQPGSECK